ncbi:hypothetical protein [Desulfitobacterium sp. PCE1]|uniref:hypothetical protein n=1 Tax=Desulfitobacterium sp. PCE1 TaxID=146907 RepID=UPI00036C5480|nr:hypothetical protein [Desulfitobacterium sp. PCE1]
MKKGIWAVVLLTLLLLVNGCDLDRTKMSSSGSEENSEVQQQSSSQSDPSLYETEEESARAPSTHEDQFTITTLNHEWKELSAKVSLSEMIFYGESRGSTNLAGDERVEYSMNIPADWTLQGTVFEDSNKKKVAEIAPVILLKQGEEIQFLDYETIEGQILTKEPISFYKYKGTKIILLMGTEVGKWYPHMYMISDGTYGFTVTIYSRNQIRDEVEERLFDDIVKTFRFRL